MTTWRIGRSPENDVVINDPSVSRRHAEITQLVDGQLLIRDLNSSGGTFVHRNGGWERIAQAQLSPGSWIKLGNLGDRIENFLGRVGGETTAAFSADDATVEPSQARAQIASRAQHDSAEVAVDHDTSAQTLAEFIHDPATERLIMPNAQYYKRAWSNMFASDDLKAFKLQDFVSMRKPPPSWNWAGFLLGPCWLAYRRCNGASIAWLLCILAIWTAFSAFFRFNPRPILLFMLGAGCIASYVLIGMYGNSWYLRDLVRKAIKLSNGQGAEPKPGVSTSAAVGMGISLFCSVVLIELVLTFTALAIPDSVRRSSGPACYQLISEVERISENPKIISMRDVRTVPLQAPVRIQAPGKVALTCEGTAFTSDGEKMKIRFYRFDAGSEYYVGYEQSE